jgi:hypothetical protein
MRRRPTDAVAPKKAVEVEPEEALVEDDELVEDVAEDEAVVEGDDTPEEEAVDGEQAEEGQPEEDVADGLPTYDIVEEEPATGFDFFAVVHADLKAAGYVSNQAQTKDIVRYIQEMMFHAAFENNEVKIGDLGRVFCEISPAKEKVANFDMKNGIKKGETYMTKPKYVFRYDMGAGAVNRLAYLETLPGYSTEDMLLGDEETAEAAE